MISVQFDNKLLSSFYLWFDHYLLKKGSAFTNNGSLFYSISNRFNGLHSYSAPFQPFVADSSINGATVMSGIWVGSTFRATGEGDLQDIDFHNGNVYFTSQQSENLSGDYAVKDFNVAVTSRPEEEILFETKFSLRPKVGQTLTGLQLDEFTYPAVFLKYYRGSNDPFAFGGMDVTKSLIRAIVLADSQYASDAIGSIFKDRVRTLIPLIEPFEMPFNGLGGLTSNPYNYDTLTTGRNERTNSVWLARVECSQLTQTIYSEIKKLNQGVFPSLIDFDLEAYRFPRS